MLVEINKKAIEVNNVFLDDAKLHIDVSKSEIFKGINDLIATPKIVNKLFLFDGLRTSQLKIFNTHDADFLLSNTSYSTLIDNYSK